MTLVSSPIRIHLTSVWPVRIPYADSKPYLVTHLSCRESPVQVSASKKTVTSGLAAFFANFLAIAIFASSRLSTIDACQEWHL